MVCKAREYRPSQLERSKSARSFAWLALVEHIWNNEVGSLPCAKNGMQTACPCVPDKCLLTYLTLPCRPTTGAYSGFFRSPPYLEKSCSAIHKRELFSRYSKMREEVTLHRSLAFTYDSQDLILLYNINTPPNTWSSKFKSKGSLKRSVEIPSPSLCCACFLFLEDEE